MEVDSSFFMYFLNAGLVVKCVLLLLVGASIASWTAIGQRGFYLSRVADLTKQFETLFWSGGDLSEMYAKSQQGTTTDGLLVIFQAGFKEFLRLRQQTSVSMEAMMDSVRRAMRVAQMREQDKLEAHLPLLATVGSISPYVGLFGTVWGIMLSLRSLSTATQATITMVAPGLAEALIATAMGLLAAIPAVIAYNRYMTDIGRLVNRFDAFQDEFANILFRQMQSVVSLDKKEH